MPESSDLRVVVADDHYLVREGVTALLEESGEVTVVGQAADAAELLALVAAQTPDAVITDIRMPPTHRLEGIEAAHRIRERHPDIGVVVLSQHADESYAYALLEHGSRGLGYLLKDQVGDLEELLRALRAVTEGGSAIDGRIVDALVARRTRHDEGVLADLTERERAVLHEMAQGKNNAGVAASLHLSESAIEKHVSAIFTKLGPSFDDSAHRRVAAVLTFLQQRAPEAGG